MRIHKIKFNDDQVQPWAYEGKESSIYTFVEAIALSGLEDKDIRLSAGLQRRLLGYAVFGKRSFIIHKTGMFTVFGCGEHEVVRRNAWAYGIETSWLECQECEWTGDPE